MRILQLARRFVEHEWGGTETVIAQTGKQLFRRGHYSEVWTSSALSKPGEDIVSSLPVKRFNYLYPFFGLNQSAKEALDKKGGNMFSFSMMSSLLLNNKFDLYHLHTGKRFGAQVAKVARMRKKPYVITLHGGVYNVPEAERNDILSPIKGKLEWGKVLGAALGSRKLLENADAVVCVNPQEAEHIKQIMPDTIVQHLPNGVNPGDFSGGEGQRFRKAHGFKKNDKIIMCISRIDHQKNQLALIDMLALFGKGKGRPHLVLIGPKTNPDYEVLIKIKAEKLKVSDFLHIYDPMPHGSQELTDAYASADVFVLPSVHEPFGIVLLEAFSAKCPVVATAVGGIPYFLENGVNGMLVPSGDVDAMFAATKNILNEKTIAQELGEEAYKTVEKFYTWERVTEQLLELYQTLVKG